TFDGLADKWNALFDLRDDVMKALEIARADKKIGKSLDAKVVIYPKFADQMATLSAFADQLKTVFIVSGVELCEGEAPADAFSETVSGIAVSVCTPDGCKCDRCWSYSTEGKAAEDGFLCARCLSIIED
ncbi:MAG: isoleucine--tRNA ligase, partial [Clostridia bacterium]|nr:isoleucine--tRNA ligase [Clostridia bacterium]